MTSTTRKKTTMKMKMMVEKIAVQIENNSSSEKRLSVVNNGDGVDEDVRCSQPGLAAEGGQPQCVLL
jgi:hypothetical protein